MATLCSTSRGESQPVARNQAWTTITHPEFVNGSHSDGDSVQVQYQGVEYIFRLYFVDTPETKSSALRRLESQAEYFGLPPRSSRRLMALGARASLFTREKLSKPFVIHTCWQRVDPESSNPSIRAFVETTEGDLAALLVSMGYAAIRRGTATAPHPDGRSAAQITAHLRNLEAIARSRQLGAWGLGKREELRTATPARREPSSVPLVFGGTEKGDPTGTQSPGTFGVLDAGDESRIRASVGQIVTIRGRIGRIGQTSSGSITFLNFESNERGEFVVIVREAFLPDIQRSIPNGLEAGLQGRIVEVTGPVILYQQTPQIELTSPDQVRVIE